MKQPALLPKRLAPASPGEPCRGCRAFRPCRRTTKGNGWRHALHAEQQVGGDFPSITALPEGEALKRWITNNGGYVHPALVLSDETQCGSRGTVAYSAIIEQAVQGEPLVTLPERLFLTSELSRDTFQSKCLKYGLPKMERCLDSVLQLSILLAVERNLGDQSWWWPYINALPPQPPCAWWMSSTELRQKLAALGHMASQWESEVCVARNAVEYKADAVAQSFGKFLGFDTDAMMWAMGQVLSRCFGNDEESGLLPFVDLCNHHASAQSPDGEDINDEPCAVLRSTVDGEPRALAAGDELYISYLPTATPFKTFLSFGFIPAELMPT